MNCIFCYNDINLNKTHYKCERCKLHYHLNCWNSWSQNNIKLNKNNKMHNQCVHCKWEIDYVDIDYKNNIIYNDMNSILNSIINNIN